MVLISFSREPRIPHGLYFLSGSFRTGSANLRSDFACRFGMQKPMRTGSRNVVRDAAGTVVLTDAASSADVGGSDSHGPMLAPSSGLAGWAGVATARQIYAEELQREAAQQQWISIDCQTADSSATKRILKQIGNALAHMRRYHSGGCHTSTTGCELHMALQEAAMVVFFLVQQAGSGNALLQRAISCYMCVGSAAMPLSSAWTCAQLVEFVAAFSAVAVEACRAVAHSVRQHDVLLRLEMAHLQHSILVFIVTLQSGHHNALLQVCFLACARPMCAHVTSVLHMCTPALPCADNTRPAGTVRCA